METQFELDKEQKEIKQKIFPYLKALAYEIVQKQPENIEKFMIDFLTKQGNYTTSGLTKEEKKELEFLRVAVKHYRDLENHSLVSSQKEIEIKKDLSTDSENSSSEENDDVMDENEEEIINKKLENIKKTKENQNSLKARVSVSAEAYGFYNKKQNFVPRIIPKNEDQMNRIKGKIISSFIFSSLDKKDLDVVINAMEEKRFKLNENVITQGDDGDCLYIVETGILKCYKTFNPESSPKFLKQYESGDSFGELALLYNCPRAATIVCSSDECILWSLDRETFNNIVKEAAQKKREKYENFLKNVDILSTIDSYELGQICDSLKDGIYKKDDYIIREGEFGDVFYILEEGKCHATKTLEPGKPETIINELKEGDYFGERALLRGEPRYANIVVSSDTAKVISLDRLSFNRLLGPIMDILKRNMDKYQVYCVNNNNDENNNEMSKFMSNSESKSNINTNSLNNLNDILTSNNIDNRKINNPLNDNNPINIINDDLNNNENNIINNEEKQNNYANINENENLNNIITSDDNELVDDNNINENNNDKKEDNDINEKKEDNNNKENIENNDINNNENENDDKINNNLTSLNDVLISNNNLENKNDNNIIEEKEKEKEDINENENENDNENKDKEKENENNENIEEMNDGNPIENKEDKEDKEEEPKEEKLESLANMLEYKSNE